MTDVPSTRSDTVRTVEPLTLCDADDTLVPSESPAYDASVDVVRSRTRSPEGLGRPGRTTQDERTFEQRDRGDRYLASCIGRESGEWGIREYLEPQQIQWSLA